MPYLVSLSEGSMSALLVLLITIGGKSTQTIVQTKLLPCLGRTLMRALSQVFDADPIRPDRKGVAKGEFKFVFYVLQKQSDRILQI